MFVYTFCPRQFERARCRIIIMSCLHWARIIHIEGRYIQSGMRKQIFYPMEIGHQATFFGRRGCDEWKKSASTLYGHDKTKKNIYNILYIHMVAAIRTTFNNTERRCVHDILLYKCSFDPTRGTRPVRERPVRRVKKNNNNNTGCETAWGRRMGVSRFTPCHFYLIFFPPRSDTESTDFQALRLIFVRKMYDKQCSAMDSWRLKTIIGWESCSWFVRFIIRW